MTYKKKLIEVALPLEAINKASAREKSIRHGHPSTLHLWWARRPLAAARAVIFAQMVDDPSAHPDLFPTEKKQEKERQRLFKIIEDLVQWENTNNETVLQRARDEIWQSWRRACAENADHPRAKELFNRDKLPAFHDPFAGGGALPLEAQRLGLEAYASDLNPVAVLICKAMIEIPPKFAGRPPVNPKSRADVASGGSWRGAAGLAQDVRYYGQWMRDEAQKRIGQLYPPVEITATIVKERPDLKPYLGQRLAVVAWLWARTVKSPNPAFSDVDVPLASTFMLSTKAGKEAHIEPVIEDGGFRFAVKTGKPKNAEQAKNGTKLSRGANFKCLMSGTPIAGEYIKAEGQAGRMGARLMAIVAEGQRGRVYLAPTPEHEVAAREAKPEWKPEMMISGSTQYLGVKPYGMDRFDQLFTSRQLVALATFSNLVLEARDRIREDATNAGLAYDASPLRDGGTGSLAYAEATATYLALASSRAADAWAGLVSWRNAVEATRGTFGRQALAMVWDFAEANPFSDSCGNWSGACLEWVSRALVTFPATPRGSASQADAATQTLSDAKVVSTDPPYFDNVPYADLSDFFYVWLRRSLRTIFPDLLQTLAVPKAEELVAFAYRHEKGRPGAEEFFLNGMTRAMHRLAEQAHPAFPITIYYAFKQTEEKDDIQNPTASTGWETFLGAVIRAGFATTGTWPTRTEKPGRMRENEANALASSIVLVCRIRAADATTATRREFVAGLQAELPSAVRQLQEGNIAPVDLAQAAIGPGMAVYTRYAKVLDAEGKTVPVRDALSLINQVLDETLAEQEGEFDADSRFALAWFEQYGFADGEYGVAETLSTAKVTSVGGLREAGIVASKAGRVRLLRPDELPEDWDPDTESRVTLWECVHQLIRALKAGGESAAAELMARLGARGEGARDLAYRLYTIAERKKRAADALTYNGLVQSWPEIARIAKEGASAGRLTTEPDLFDERKS
jgi:putative DNA methylase